MANRVLKRPMFRMGGSPNFEFQEKTSGILSGLDGPKLSASRTGYDAGGFAEIIEAQDKASKEYLGEDDYKAKAGMPGSASSALMNFGLNLLAQPGGNLFGSIGKAGSPVLRQFQTAREAERLDKRKAERRRKGDVLDRAADIFEAQIEASGEAGRDEFSFEAMQNSMKGLQSAEKQLNKDIDALKLKKDAGTATEEELASLQEKITDKGNNEELQVLITKNPPKDVVGLTLLKQIENGLKDMDEYYEYLDDPSAYRQKVIAEAKKKREGSRDGGRAGYQVGGEVIEDVAMMTETMPAPGPTAPAQTQDLTYDELRSRLPREITDDVVTLISTSKQALTDFANIQTQQDVDNFNKLYNVNLVLPQEG
jgi:hypothetical protein|tara:strand:+ start:2615 stop:3715 length:1101 start_codon:yes stop_codon:yes gene_type:complete